MFKNRGKYGAQTWLDTPYPLEDNINILKKLVEEGAQLLITTSRKNKKAIFCLTDDKKIPCKIPVGTLKNDISPTFALSKIAENYAYNLPKPKFLNETQERLFINIYDLLSKRYNDLNRDIKVLR